MTDEQIKQNAIKAAADFKDWHHPQMSFYDGYITGAHSRDEEVFTFSEASKIKDKHILRLLKENKNLKKELDQLCNPLISVEERLPMPRKDDTRFSKNCLVLYKDQESGISYITEAYYDFGYKGNGGWVLTFGDDEHFFYSDYQEDGCIVTHWMPKPELKKGGTQ